MYNAGKESISCRIVCRHSFLFAAKFKVCRSPDFLLSSVVPLGSARAGALGLEVSSLDILTISETFVGMCDILIDFVIQRQPKILLP